VRAEGGQPIPLPRIPGTLLAHLALMLRDKTPFSADGDSPSATLAEVAAEKVRDAILSGAIAPGSKLHIQRLSDEFGLSATPMREGLARLVATGLIEALGQRGFRALPISLEDLADIQRMRHLVEVEGLKLSIQRGDLTWEQNIVAALHRLKSLSVLRDNPERATEPDAPRFDHAHKAFHTALIAACGSPRLLNAHSDLHDQFYRYRVVLRLVPRTKAATDRDHGELARLVLARDVDAAAKALHTHIEAPALALSKLPVLALKKAFEPG
jgi:GntR family transcriptional regulator, carbon starvation induced regulator